MAFDTMVKCLYASLNVSLSRFPPSFECSVVLFYAYMINISWTMSLLIIHVYFNEVSFSGD